MDGSRRFSKVYGKTESGAEALTSARGALTSSARQLLILVDGQRDMRELSAIFGEEALNRLLPQLESQGLVRDLSEPPALSEPTGRQSELRPVVESARTQGPATIQSKSPDRPSELRPVVESARTQGPATIQSKSPGRPSELRPVGESTRTQAPVTLSSRSSGRPSELRPVGESARAEEPAPISSKPPQRYLAVPIAIGASLLTALAIVYWIFAREQNVAENPQVVAAPPSAPQVSDAGGRHPSVRASVDAPVATAMPRSETPEPLTLPVAPDPKHAPARTDALPSTESRPVPPIVAVRPAEANPRKADARKTTSDAGYALASAAPAKLEESSATPAPAQPVASNPAATDSVDARPGPAPVLHERSRVLPTISQRAQRSGIYAGSAVVRLHVNSAGAVERVELVSATPPQVYDRDVEQALQQWTFDPPGNSAVMTVELDFRPQSVAPPKTTGKPVDPP